MFASLSRPACAVGHASWETGDELLVTASYITRCSQTVKQNLLKGALTSNVKFSEKQRSDTVTFSHLKEGII